MFRGRGNCPTSRSELALQTEHRFHCESFVTPHGNADSLVLRMALARSYAALAIGVLIGLGASGVACSESEGPAPTGPVAGIYAADKIVRQQETLDDDLQDQGARFNLILNSDSTLTGRVELPANIRITGESDAVNQDLTGTWSLHRDEVRLHLDEPVLGNQPVFRVGNDGLSGTLIVPDPINGALFLTIGLVKVGP